MSLYDLRKKMFKICIGLTMQKRGIMKIGKKVTTAKKLPYNTYIKYHEYWNIFRSMGYEKPLAKQFLFNNQYLFRTSVDDILAVYNVCKKWQVDMTTAPINGKLFTLSPDLVENRIMLLAEMGAKNIDAASISQYPALSSNRMGLFKASMMIPKDVNVTQQLCQYIKTPPPDVPPLEPLSDDLTYVTFRTQFLEWYLPWRLNLSDDNKKHLDCATAYLRQKSLRILEKQIKIMHDDIGVTGKKVLQKGFLAPISTDELEKVLNNVKVIAGIDTRKLLRIIPEMQRLKYDNVMKVQQIVEERCITNKMLRYYPQIFLMPHEKLQKIFKIIDGTPELEVLKSNCKWLKMLRSFNHVLARLDYLRYHNVKNVTVYLLTGRRRSFDRITTRNYTDKSTGREIGISLEKKLKLNWREIARQIKKHPYWHCIGLISIHDTVTYLLEHFSPQDLHDNLQLILYPKKKIDEILKNLPKMTNEYDKKLSNKEIVGLCLYEIERHHHFNGDGIWSHDCPRSTKSRLSMYVFDDASDSENTETEEPIEMIADSADNLRINGWTRNLVTRVDEK